MSILLPNDRAKIETWFSKPIYVKNNFAKKEHGSIKDWLLEFFAIYGEFKRTGELNVNTTHEVHDLMVEPVFNDFRLALDEEVSQFASTIGYGYLTDRIRMQNMWSNISRKGDYLFPHNHPTSIISGAYYVESTSPKDVIKFYDNPQSMLPPPVPNGQLGFQDTAYQCTEKRLILFKSDFMHGCPALVGDRKIVISFNYGIG